MQAGCSCGCCWVLVRMLVRVLLGVLKVRWQLLVVLLWRCRQGVVVGAGQGAVWREGRVMVAGSACLAEAVSVLVRVLVRVLLGMRVLLDVLKVRWQLLLVLVWRAGMQAGGQGDAWCEGGVVVVSEFHGVRCTLWLLGWIFGL